MCRNLTLHGFAWPTGGFGEFEVVPARSCHLVPEEVPSDVAARVEPLAVGLRALHRSGLRPGQDAIIFGAGPARVS